MKTRCKLRWEVYKIYQYLQSCGYKPREARFIIWHVKGEIKPFNEMSEEECKDLIKRLIVLGLA